MYLTAMTHRDELFDLTLRWMNDDFDPDDGNRVTRIFVYESAISAIVIERIIRFLGRFFNETLHSERILQKQALRERIIAGLSLRTSRMNALADDFHKNPTYFFPHLPVDAIAITTSKARLVAIGRIKRLSRVAEKVSFRLVDALFKEIQAKATLLAEKRAAAAGISLADFVSSPAAMQNDFMDAEASVAHRFKEKNIHIAREALTVNDIIGFKIIGRPEMLDRLPYLLSQEPGITVVEIERHTGDYNAVNLLLDMELPPPNTLASHLRKADWGMASRRGLNPGDIREHVSGYVSQGSGMIRMELILTTDEELMEAEFGRSTHELRVLRLRQRQTYSGPLGQNAGYLIEFLLALASSPTISIPEIPIKMYGRYLPEAISSLKCALHGNIIDDGLLGSFCMQRNCPDQFCSGK